MPIKKTPQSTDSKWIIEFDNGDLQALKTILEKYRFVSEEALLRYALVALLEAEDKLLYIKKNNQTVALRPNENLIKPEG